MGQLISKIKKKINKSSILTTNDQLNDRLINADVYDNQISELEMYSGNENYLRGSDRYFFIEQKINDNFEKICKYFDEKIEILEDEIREKIDNKFLNHQEEINELVVELRRMKEELCILTEENNNYKKLVEEDISIYKSCYDINKY